MNWSANNRLFYDLRDHDPFEIIAFAFIFFSSLFSGWIFDLFHFVKNKIGKKYYLIYYNHDNVVMMVYGWVGDTPDIHSDAVNVQRSWYCFFCDLHTTLSLPLLCLMSVCELWNRQATSLTSILFSFVCLFAGTASLLYSYSCQSFWHLQNQTLLASLQKRREKKIKYNK